MSYQSFPLLAGKNVAITGATTGIGRGIALGMAKAGANIAIVYLPSEAENAKTLGEEIAIIRGTKGTFVAIPGDVSEQQTAIDLVKTCVDKFGEINVMVANAGICKYHDFLDTSADLYYKHIKINLDGVYFMVQEAGRQMKAQGKGGSIIATGSIRSLLGGAPLVPYTASKGGVLSVVQAAAVALGPYNIRVNCLMPGAIETPLAKEELKEEDRKHILRRVPMHRMGTPEDLAGPAIFLASDMSGYLNGSEMLVDGGMYVNLE
ncbi:probable NADP-dependent mannitol dehydrogenase [Trichomonascus vanleenenianus]|uniref:SDR family NAD(P)-dependent oxidoreductase n=1 Tax=Trichomonascus vanleenenianus TaxID=2268995 RepID=UPI003ECB923E